MRVHHLRAHARAQAGVRLRRIITAYMLWLFFPLVWPGAYLFYLGRDTHALLHSISFGGFGIGWLADAFYIPSYVADYNEPRGYFEAVEKQHARRFSLSGFFAAPLTLLVQAAVAVYVGVIAAYLVPRPLVWPEALQMSPLSKQASAVIGFCVGMAALAGAAARPVRLGVCGHV